MTHLLTPQEVSVLIPGRQPAPPAITDPSLVHKSSSYALTVLYLCLQHSFSHYCQLYSARLPMGPIYQFLSFCLCPLFLSGMDFH